MPKVKVIDIRTKEQFEKYVFRVKDGANILPYFYSQNQWQVILIEQLRPAVKARTLEAPGGILEGEVKESMARELKEETGIQVDPEKIEIVFKEYALPQLLDNYVYGGIVELENYQDTIPSFPLFVIPLSHVLRRRNILAVCFDLWTSRLLDEVAKKVNLIPI